MDKAVAHRIAHFRYSRHTCDSIAEMLCMVTILSQGFANTGRIPFSQFLARSSADWRLKGLSTETMGIRFIGGRMGRQKAPQQQTLGIGILMVFNPPTWDGDGWGAESFLHSFHLNC